MKITLLWTLLFIIQASRADGAVLAPDSINRQKAEEVIWASELSYFTRLYKADHKGVLLFTDSLFTAWPALAEKPLNREQSLLFMKKYFPSPTRCQCSIRKDAITFYNDMAMTLFRVLASCPDKNGVLQTRMTRINHVWIKRGSLWRLLGGSSGPSQETDPVE